MAFMNALDLIKGNTTTTLNPNGTCTKIGRSVV